MIIITGTILLNDAGRQAAIELGLEHSKRSRSEVGCISHDCYIAADDPCRMHFFERWSDIDAVKRHFAVPESGQFIRDVSALADSKPEIAIFSADPLEGALV